MVRKIEEENEVEDNSIHIGKYITYGALVIVALILLLGGIYTIGAGERGVLLTFGKASMDSKMPGLHFKIPIVQGVIKMDVKTQKYEAELTAASKDLQDVKTKIAINYHIMPDSTPEIYRDIGTNYADKVIYPLEQEVNKAATAQFTAEELITKRDQVRETMKTILMEKLAQRKIVVEEISIINFAFSDSFTQAIEAKVTAEQQALTAKNKLEQVKYEAQQRIEQANGEANAIRIQADAIRAQGGKEYVQLQAINRWDGKLPTFMMSGAMPFISIPTNSS